MYHFVITAATISGNKGAESMFTSVYQNMHSLYPDSHFYLLSYYPRADRFSAPGPNVSVLSGTPLRLLLITSLAFLHRVFRFFRPLARLLEREPAIRALAQADLVLDVGGITFSDGREKYLPFNIVTILPSLLMGRRTIKCSQAMGPFEHRTNRACAKWLLPKLDRILARGEQTENHLLSLDLTNVSRASDLAFATDREAVAMERILTYCGQSTKQRVGVSPSSVLYKKCRRLEIDYIGIMALFCSALQRQWDLEVVLMPHSIRLDTERLKNNDLPIVRRIADAAEKKGRLIVVGGDLSGAEMRALIQRCDYYVASRFHAMVSALAVGVPLIVFGWGHKYFEVLKDFQMQDYALDYSELSLDKLLLQFERLMANGPALRCHCEAVLPEIRRSARMNFETAGQILENQKIV